MEVVFLFMKIFLILFSIAIFIHFITTGFYKTAIVSLVLLILVTALPFVGNQTILRTETHTVIVNHLDGIRLEKPVKVVSKTAIYPSWSWMADRDNQIRFSNNFPLVGDEVWIYTEDGKTLLGYKENK